MADRRWRLFNGLVDTSTTLDPLHGLAHRRLNHDTDTNCTAYWIAFGPHGPRSLPPPGEGTKVFAYTMLGVAATGVIFGLARYFAKGSPGTMNREYQEASDAYLKVSNSSCPQSSQIHRLTEIATHRSPRSSPSPVSRPKITRAASPFRASQRPNRLSKVFLFASTAQNDTTRPSQHQWRHLSLFSSWKLVRRSMRRHFVLLSIWSCTKVKQAYHYLILAPMCIASHSGHVCFAFCLVFDI